MKKLILPFVAVFLVGLLVNHFRADDDLGERVVLSKGAQAAVSQKAKFDQLGYAERNIALNKTSELDARKAEFNFENPCAKKELFVTMDGASFVTYKKQAYSVFDDTEMRTKLVASQNMIDGIRNTLDDMNPSNVDSKVAMISSDIEKLVTTQNYFAQEILKKLPSNNDFSYVIAQKTIEDTMANLVPLNILIFCRANNSSACDSIRNAMKKAVDSDSLLFANNIEKNIYFNSTEGQDNLESDRMVCKADINASKLALQNSFSSLYAQNMTDNINSAKLSPFN